MKKYAIAVLTLGLMALAASSAMAVSSYKTAFLTQYPAKSTSTLNSCTLCHAGSPSINNVNAYGNDYANAGYVYTAIEALDSDGDGSTNIAEINANTWPGDATSKPGAVADATKPTVSTFTIPATSASLTVAIGAFTATDNVGVTGYLITTTATAPAAGAAGWSGTAPVSYVFANGTANGLKTLYAWVKDAAGNVSLAKSATVTINVGVTSSAKADFNADGSQDLVFRNTANGMNIVWYMNGVNRIGSGTLLGLTDQNWKLAGVNDFDGDGKPDLLWRNTVNGMNVVWYMNGVTRTSTDSLPAAAPAWSIVGTGDFNNDGNADIVLRNTTTGQNIVWHMNGALRVGSGTLPALADQNWTIAGIDDFNGDGKPDLLWRNTVNGMNVVWYMNGVTRTGSDSLPSAVAAWSIVGTGDFNGDGSTDIVFRNTTTGQNIVWYMNGALRVGSGTLPALADQNWTIAGN